MGKLLEKRRNIGRSSAEVAQKYFHQAEIVPDNAVILTGVIDVTTSFLWKRLNTAELALAVTATYNASEGQDPQSEFRWTSKGITINCVHIS